MGKEGTVRMWRGWKECPDWELLITGRGSSKQPHWCREESGKVNWSNWREPEQAERQDLNVNCPKPGGNRIKTEPYSA